MQKKERIYEGKAKIVYNTDDPDLIIQYFKDDTTAFNSAKRGIIVNKGVFNNGISTKVFEFLKAEGMPTHFERRLSDREMLVKRVEILPIEVIVRNVAAGSICRNLGLREGTVFSSPVLEFSYKKDALNDPLINESHIRALGLASDEEMETVKGYAGRFNELMSRFFANQKLDLIDFKLEFGRYKTGIILADEVSPDTCRLWETGTGIKFDKDRFRYDMEDVEGAYQEVLSRVEK